MPVFRKLRLQGRTNLVVAATLLAFFLITVWLDYRQQEQFVLDESVEKARLIAYQTIRTRDYLSAQLQQGDVVLNESRVGLIPVLASNRIGAQVAGDIEYRIRQVSDRHRNPANAPDFFEERNLQRFRSGAGDEIYQITGTEQARSFRYMQAFRADQSCLECHGDPADAPTVIRELYPPETDKAYNYPLGEVIGAISVQIPMDRLQQQVLARVWKDAFTTGGIFLALIFCLSLLSQTTVLQPLKKLEAAISRINNSGTFDQQLAVEREDEIGELISGFNRMVASLDEKGRELADSEARYRILTDTARDGIISFLPDGKIILFNQQASRLFGYSKLESLGMSIVQLIHPDNRQIHQLGVEAYFVQYGAELLSEVQLMAGQKRDGTRLGLELSLSRVETEDYSFYTAIVRQLT